MLKIKKGSTITAFGEYANSFDEQSNLSQEVLEYLKAKYPEDIEGDYKASKEVAALVKETVFVDVPASVSGDKIALTSNQNAAAVTVAQDEPAVAVEVIEEISLPVKTKKK